MGLFDKDGLLTNIIEMIPGGGLITAPVHAAAGNHGHAAAAAAAGGVIGLVLPGAGAGRVIAKGGLHGAKALVAREGIKVAARAAIAVGKKGLARGVAKSLAKHAVKKAGNAIKKLDK